MCETQIGNTTSTTQQLHQQMRSRGVIYTNTTGNPNMSVLFVYVFFCFWYCKSKSPRDKTCVCTHREDHALRKKVQPKTHRLNAPSSASCPRPWSRRNSPQLNQKINQICYFYILYIKLIETSAANLCTITLQINYELRSLDHDLEP